MSPSIRAIVSIIIVAVLTYQALRTPARTYKQYAFIVAAVGFGLLALFNGQIALQGQTAWWSTVVMQLVSVVLIFTSLVLLMKSWHTGELREQFDRARQAVEEERTRRKKQE